MKKPKEKKKPKEEKCTICLCGMKKEDITLPDCGHRFHLECLEKVIGKKCPLCRKPMPYGVPEKKDMIYFFNHECLLCQVDTIHEMLTRLSMVTSDLEKMQALGIEVLDSSHDYAMMHAKEVKVGSDRER